MDDKTIEKGKLKFVVKWGCDDCADLSYLGKFTDTIDDNIPYVDRSTGHLVYPGTVQKTVAEEEYQEFDNDGLIYDYDYDEISNDLVHVEVVNHVNIYASMNRNEYKFWIPCNHHDCSDDELAYIEQDYNRHVDYGIGWSMMYCVVELFVDNASIEIDSLSGIYSDDTTGYHETVEQELINSLVNRIPTNITKLKSTIEILQSTL